MGKLKKGGRGARRLRKQIDEMHPDQFYPLKVGGRVVPMKGSDWKKAKDGKPITKTD